MEQVLEAAWDAGARSAFYTVLRLPWEVSPLFREWLACTTRSVPTAWRASMTCGAAGLRRGFFHAHEGLSLWRSDPPTFRQSLCGLGFNRQRVMLDTTHFRRPSPAGQQTLF